MKTKHPTNQSQQDLKRVAECLYRSQNSNIYYAILKRGGKQIKRSLKTVLAKRRLKDLTQDQVDRENKTRPKHEPFRSGNKCESLSRMGRIRKRSFVSTPDKSKASVSHMIKVAVGITKSAAIDQKRKIETIDEFVAYLKERIRLYGVSVKTEI